MVPRGTSWPDVPLPRLPSDPALSFQAVWVVTWLAVVVLNVDVGLAVGVVFSMMTVIYRTQRYRSARRPAQPHVRARLLGTCRARELRPALAWAGGAALSAP